jgi:hypothetical protein
MSQGLLSVLFVNFLKKILPESLYDLIWMMYPKPNLFQVS